MPSLQKFLIPAVMSFAVAANARFNLGGDIFGKRLVTNCPTDWTPINYNGDGRCCHGSLTVEDNNDPYCCVMDYDQYRDTADDVHSALSGCFPFCSGTNYDGPTSTWSNEANCITRVAFTANDYSSIVTTTTDGSAYTTASATSTYTDSNGNPTSTGYTTGDSTRNAAPAVTAGAVLGGAAVAAVLFAL
ncbi:uncharacterized protein N7483_009467 [Penicillium malachiteum]|uniref:uncharacterized protein n=1 Tax=Penicillium malachiteum TaxID=1324776 RepID=UPI002546B138|nr:uncharacterized protein N7483_009467 [Penicillium malachiteum]KAJ5721533.1 hypothetical protein N7483_009467 [Penicillium malachiteum]